MITICKRCILHDQIPGVTINHEGVCSACERYDQYKEIETNITAYLRQQLEKLCENIKKEDHSYDVLVMYSGGKDSTMLLKLAKEELELKPLAITIVHPLMNEIAKHNVETATYKLGIDLLKVHIPDRIYTKVMRQAIQNAPAYKLDEFFGCTACHFMMTWTTIRYAMMLKIPLVFEGSDISQTGEAVFRNAEKIRVMIKRGESPFGQLNQMIHDALGAETPLHLRYDADEILTGHFPTIVSPHTFMGYDTTQSNEYIQKLGLKGKDFKTIYTNCSAQPFFSSFSLKRYNCVSYIHHYASEIRRGYPNLMQMSLEDKKLSESVLSRETIMKLIGEYEKIIDYVVEKKLDSDISEEERKKIRSLAPTYMQAYGLEVCNVFLNDVLKIPYFSRYFGIDRASI